MKSIATLAIALCLVSAVHAADDAASAPEQAALIALRDKSSHFRSFAVEGVAN